MYGELGGFNPAEARDGFKSYSEHQKNFKCIIVSIQPKQETGLRGNEPPKDTEVFGVSIQPKQETGLRVK